MKTRDIKTGDVTNTPEENQDITKKVVQPLSQTQPTRQRAPRNSQKTRPQELDVQKTTHEVATAPAAPVEKIEQEVGMERNEMPLPREEQGRTQQQAHFQPHAFHERAAYAKRPLEDLSLSELIQYARRYGIMGATLTKKDELLRKVRYAEENPHFEMAVEGVLEKLPDGFGFLRSSLYDYVSGPDDIYVSPSQIRRFGLRTGDTIKGEIRKPKEGEKYFALLKVSEVNYAEPLSMIDRSHFDSLSPQHPIQKFNLEFDPSALSTRILDLFTPVGKGQRGLIVAPPKVGKTLLLKEIARAIIQNHREVHLIVLCVDERPEEVADMRRALKGTMAEVISSTFDESAERHVQVAEIVLEKAKRLVECNRDVVILLGFHYSSCSCIQYCCSSIR